MNYSNEFKKRIQKRMEHETTDKIYNDLITEYYEKFITMEILEGWKNQLLKSKFKLQIQEKMKFTPIEKIYEELNSLYYKDFITLTQLKKWKEQFIKRKIKNKLKLVRENLSFILFNKNFVIQ